jgi:hypothetical protein
VIFAWWLSAALAADWPMLQGTEPGPQPAAIRPWGFLQALAEGVVFGSPLGPVDDPALAPFVGERPLFNRVGSGDATWGFTVRRVRMGLRGAIPKTDGRISWIVGIEAGDNGITRTSPVVLTDASVTVSYIPGLRLRVGQFKLPLGEEALENNPSAADFINPTAATNQLLLENPVADGAYLSGAGAFRDIGVEAFYTFPSPVGHWSYALMLSNGRMGVFENDDRKDLTHRLGWTWVWGDPDDAERDEVGVYAFWQQGERLVDGDEVMRIRRGGGIKLQRLGWQARVELVQGRGAIELGPDPPFPGAPISVLPDAAGVGGHALLHYTRGPAGGGVRYDELWRGTDDPDVLRVFRTLAFDAQLRVAGRFRLLVDYELRWMDAPKGSDDARALARTLGDRVGIQAAVSF